MKTHENNISQLQTGNPGFFEELYKLYFKRLRGYAFKFTGDTEAAGDIVNECFLKLWKNRKTIQCENAEHLKNYLFQMVRNESLDYLTAAGYREGIDNSLLHEIEKEEAMDYYNFFHDPENLYIVEELKNHIYHTIDKLPEPCKKVFYLSRDDGLKNREIAEKLEMSIKNVEYHISKALKMIYKELQNKYPQ